MQGMCAEWAYFMFCISECLSGFSKHGKYYDACYLLIALFDYFILALVSDRWVCLFIPLVRDILKSGCQSISMIQLWLLDVVSQIYAHFFYPQISTCNLFSRENFCEHKLPQKFCTFYWQMRQEILFVFHLQIVNIYRCKMTNSNNNNHKNLSKRYMEKMRLKDMYIVMYQKVIKDTETIPSFRTDRPAQTV